MGTLDVYIDVAQNVPNVETFGKSDPYVSLELQGVTQKSEVVKGELNPAFKQSLSFPLRGSTLKPGDVLKVYIKDWEMVGRNRLLGQEKILMKDVIRTNKQDITLKMVDSNERPTACTLKLSLSYTPPTGGKGGGSRGTVVDVDDEEEPFTADSSQVVSSANAFDDEDDSEEEDDEDEVDGAGDEVDGAPGGGKKRRRRKKKKKKRGGHRKIRALASKKPQDFQIRVKVCGARQIAGANISPVTRVTCYNQVQQTRVQKSTNSPCFNETFFFNFVASPAELFDQLITFGIYNSRKLRSDAFIASFKCDIGMIYDESQHTLLNKWLLLSDPDDNMAGAKGYLKICATVLGPGDDAPSFKSSDKDDDEDIESNLLRPAGVQLRPATFTLKLYRAEDIPRMDSDMFSGMKKVFGGNDDEKKELVDPYFVLTFAGKEIRSKIMYNSDHPEFNQELKLGLRFPSMCERIKLQMFDWDRVSEDDAIGTAFLSISHISAAGDSDKGEDGFLPSFGPCYVNFYGSPREFSELADEYEDLNLGKGTGVAYRGRVLLSLETHLGDMPEVEVEDMGPDDILRVQKFQRRRKYKLHVAFMNATMISSVDEAVEFEVSIGNYGNKLDEHVPPSSSSTQPTNAVFDGCYYYFLPWGDNKPVIVVDSHWEDISFRLESLNFMLRIKERLEANIEKVRVGIQANLATPELAQLLISLLDQLVTDCKKPLPKVIEGQHIQNELDKQGQYYRVNELETIVREASNLRENATDINDALSEVENYLGVLDNLCIEPQNSMPDVVIWMIAGSKRVAYFRIAANHVLWSSNPDYRGKYCGKLDTIMLQYPGNKAVKDDKWEIPALLRMKIWLGLERHQHEWHRMQTEGELAVFAESYENQVSILGNWTNKGPTMTRPKFSDATGKTELKKDDFIAPPGWAWVEDWYISPELSMLYDKDSGHTNYLEDIYECESRIPGGYWVPASISYTDVKGDSVPGKEETELPDGWEWQEDWSVDLNRAVDEEGWEYCVEATMGGYGAVEKNYHLCRRRRLVRMRKLVKTSQMMEEEDKEKGEIAEGWEYAPLFNMKFHFKERKMDLVRRRRWHRKMIAEDPKAPCFFKIPNEEDSKPTSLLISNEDDKDELTAPRMFLTCKKSYRFQLRSYIYQARELLAGDSNGLSDPFARVAFVNQSAVTEKVEKTLCPTWDQTLIFEQVEIHGDPALIVEKPPEVIIEVFDHDTFGSAEFLGRTEAHPMVKLDPSDMRMPVLQWYPITKGSRYGGELLAAFELILMNGKDLPFLPPKRGSLFIVPNGIRPIMQRTGIEVMCWGVRNMAKYQLSNVTSPSIEFEIGGNLQASKIIRNTKKNPNFDENMIFFDIMLPKEELYTPPMNIRVRDNRQFGRKPLVGVHIIKSLEEYRCDPLMPDAGDGDAVIDVPAIAGAEVAIDIPQEKTPSGPADTKIAIQKAIQHPELWEEDIDWWSKYYASIGELDKCKMYLESGYDKIQTFDTELEKVGEYNDFTDFTVTYKLSRGKNMEEDDSGEVAGEFKGTFRVYPLPGDPNVPLPNKVLGNLPSSQPEECVVRLYIIKADDLQPSDSNGLSDPYCVIRLGKKKLDNRKEYIPNTLSPIFGRMFEMKATLPLDKDLLIQIVDYDLIGSDDVIGETIVDLENRFLSKYRATCGLPLTYCTTGPSAWRDCQTPKEILESFCQRHSLDGPFYTGINTVKVGTRIYNLTDFEQSKPTHSHLGGDEERLALHVLNTLPGSMNTPLVPEHIEVRSLYNPLQPGIAQGKIHMWVDVFPASLGVPQSPVDISQRKPKKYELRIVIWNTYDVILEEESITGEKMSDIYVKGWVSGIDDKQETDVHYRSLDGEGNFNWRFVFPFDYLPAEDTLVVKKKEHFWSLDETELHLAPILMIQIWDNDKFSADDFLGTLELNMNNMPAPVKQAKHSDLNQLPDLVSGRTVKMVSLFEQKRIKGIWPCFSDESGERELTGKVEMELELVTAEEAEDTPCGQARDEPNQHPVLDAPKRPETSFLWFTSPWKTLKMIIWKNYKWYFIGGLCIVLLILFIALFFYSIPGAVTNAIFN